MIVIACAPYTGTWFTLNLLQLNPLLNNVVDHNSSCFGIFRKEKNKDQLEYTKINYNLTHVIYYRKIIDKKTHGEIDLLCMGHKVIVPMRDPLLSIISSKKRKPLKPAYDNIDAFEYLATSLYAKKSFFFPIDTHKFKTCSMEREEIAKKMFDFVNIFYPDNLTQWAKENKFKNCMKPYLEKQEYEKGNIGKATKNCKDELDYLKSKKTILIPFLKKLGYKDLLWW